MKRTLFILTAFVLCFSSVAFAHGGKTDPKGGHRDNYNASGLGAYHYHCDGHPAHLHQDGICPYSTSDTYTMSESEKLKKEMKDNGLIQGPVEPIIIHTPDPPQTESVSEDSLFKSKEAIACILFVIAYIAALLYRIIVSKELYYFPFALSLFSLLAMFFCFFIEEPALYAAGIAAIINLFCEK